MASRDRVTLWVTLKEWKSVLHFSEGRELKHTRLSIKGEKSELEGREQWKRQNDVNKQ